MTLLHLGPPAAALGVLALLAMLLGSTRLLGGDAPGRGAWRDGRGPSGGSRGLRSWRTGRADGAGRASGHPGRSGAAAGAAGMFGAAGAPGTTGAPGWVARTARRWRGVGGRSGSGAERGARWARLADVRPLVCDGVQSGRLLLGTLCTGTRGLRRRSGRARARRGGTSRSGPRRRGPLLAVERSQSLAVIGPTQSGKTTSLAVPAILGWDGPVLAASVKTDLLADTLAWRRRCGEVRCFDPTGATGLVGDDWSPLATSGTFAEARRSAADLSEAARGEGTTADGEFWYATASKLLAPLLFAAASGGRTMADVVRWVDTQEVDEVLALLERAGVPEALHAARATWLRDDRQRSAVYTTAETVLAGFAELPADATVPGEGAGCAGRGRTIDPGELLSGANTLYVCAPAHDQRRLRALFTAVVKHVMERAFERAAASGGRMDPPLLVVLDEAANIAPLADLDGLAATCAGHGIQLVTIWQDLAQITARYGARAATVVNNHRAKVFLSGIADPGTLDHASHLVGDEELLVGSVTRDAAGARSTTTAPHHRRLLPPDALRRLPAGTGALVYGSLPPVHLALRPWWEDPVLAARAGRTEVGTQAGRKAAGPGPTV